MAMEYYVRDGKAIFGLDLNEVADEVRLNIENNKIQQVAFSETVYAGTVGINGELSEDGLSYTAIVDIGSWLDGDYEVSLHALSAENQFIENYSFSMYINNIMKANTLISLSESKIIIECRETGIEFSAFTFELKNNEIREIFGYVMVGNDLKKSEEDFEMNMMAENMTSFIVEVSPTSSWNWEDVDYEVIINGYDVNSKQIGEWRQGINPLNIIGGDNMTVNFLNSDITPLGPCEITLTPYGGGTGFSTGAKSEAAVLKYEEEKEEYSIEELGNTIVGESTVGHKASIEASSVGFAKEGLNKIGGHTLENGMLVLNPALVNDKYYEVRVHPVRKGESKDLDVIFPKASIALSTESKYKVGKDGVSGLKMVIKAIWDVQNDKPLLQIGESVPQA